MQDTDFTRTRQMFSGATKTVSRPSAIPRSSPFATKERARRSRDRSLLSWNVTPRDYLAIWHEIVNDLIGTTRLRVLLPLVQISGPTFDRRVGAARSFGVSGQNFAELE